MESVTANPLNKNLNRAPDEALKPGLKHDNVHGESGDNFLGSLLDAANYFQASDLHLKTNSKPRVRVNGELKTLNVPEIEEGNILHVVKSIRPEWKAEKFISSTEEDFSYTDARGRRYRVNFFHQRGKPSVVFRVISHEPPSLESLNLPNAIEGFADLKRGLVLVTGPTGSGKTTTLAALVRRINETRPVSITTIEDPVEILHKDMKALVSQREVGLDTDSFLSGLRSVLRQDPDVIMIGEVRDLETLRTAVSAAETGHLVLTTAHTLDAQETINRIIDMFPAHERTQARFSIAGTLKGIICQRLVPKKGKSGRTAVFEVMVNTGRISESIIDERHSKNITQIISESEYDGMQTFDEHILWLIKNDVVAIEDGLHVATKPHDIKTKLRKEGFL